ncbi:MULTISPECIES: stage III sporulation protein AA [Clostridium]|jgi:stage III sporulation protein AA|uniref:Stage III sporulation protein AA n=1 Tax=Clostridium saudiense TaxID=1414720 RepID=A0ABS2FIH9_9CLOT|nr:MULTISPECIES: stage III sporulation protein AA [Clostridium]MBM6819812.1 stage III sporulation protein AA [Clostridium saudiense]
MNYDEIYKILPGTIGNSIKQFLMEDKIQEIRIKVGKPIILNLAFEEKVLDYIPTREDLRYLITKISNYSLYAFEEEIKQGYITLKGGHRVGLAGECVMSKGEVRTIKNISSLNIRICKEVIGASNKVMRLITENDRVYNTLIVSPPKCGKTTILRDIAKNLSNGMYQISLKGKKVTIVDERSEIAACYNGIPQMNVGIRTDILDNCLKKSGMIMAIRSLSPEVLICDEIGTEGDLEALNMAFNSGVNIIVTVHGYDINDIYNRKVFKELIDNCVLERIIVLSNRRGAGTIEKVYKVSRGKGLQCLEV